MSRREIAEWTDAIGDADAGEQTLRQLRWANAKLKEASPQVMLGRAGG